MAPLLLCEKNEKAKSIRNKNEDEIKKSVTNKQIYIKEVYYVQLYIYYLQVIKLKFFKKGII